MYLGKSETLKLFYILISVFSLVIVQLSWLFKNANLLHKEKKCKLNVLKVDWNYQVIWSILNEAVLVAFWILCLWKVQANLLF